MVTVEALTKLDWRRSRVERERFSLSYRCSSKRKKMGSSWRLQNKREPRPWGSPKCGLRAGQRAVPGFGRNRSVPSCSNAWRLAWGGSWRAESRRATGLDQSTAMPWPPRRPGNGGRSMPTMKAEESEASVAYRRAGGPRLAFGKRSKFFEARAGLSACASRFEGFLSRWIPCSQPRRW